MGKTMSQAVGELRGHFLHLFKPYSIIQTLKASHTGTPLWQESRGHQQNDRASGDRSPQTYPPRPPKVAKMAEEISNLEGVPNAESVE